MAERIQRKRTKGWRMPPNTVSVTRPGMWGNPFRLGDFVIKGDADPDYRGPFKMTYVITTAKHANASFTELKTGEQVLEWYRWYMGVAAKPMSILRGKNLACWCKVGALCHADILLELTNA
jgi:hypothetical protein